MSASTTQSSTQTQQQTLEWRRRMQLEESLCHFVETLSRGHSSCVGQDSIIDEDLILPLSSRLFHLSRLTATSGTDAAKGSLELLGWVKLKNYLPSPVSSIEDGSLNPDFPLYAPSMPALNLTLELTRLLGLSMQTSSPSQTKISILIDCSNSSFSQLDISLFQTLFSSLARHYRADLKLTRVILWNMSWVMKRGWDMVKYYLVPSNDQTTQGKNTSSSKWMDRLVFASSMEELADQCGQEYSEQVERVISSTSAAGGIDDSVYYTQLVDQITSSVPQFVNLLNDFETLRPDRHDTTALATLPIAKEQLKQQPSPLVIDETADESIDEEFWDCISTLSTSTTAINTTTGGSKYVFHSATTSPQKRMSYRNSIHAQSHTFMNVEKKQSASLLSGTPDSTGSSNNQKTLWQRMARLGFFVLARSAILLDLVRHKVMTMPQSRRIALGMLALLVFLGAGTVLRRRRRGGAQNRRRISL